MIDFTRYSPVALHTGHRCIEKNAAFFLEKGSRAFVLTSRFEEGYHNLALDDVCGVFDAQRINYSVNDTVEENPSVESIRDMADEILDFKPEFILAIGGGSALDTAKAANVLIRFPKGADAYKVFYEGTTVQGGSRSQGLLPLFGVPTTAGSGSEAAGYAVLTRSDIGTKLRMNQLSFFDDAFLDARYIEGSPQWLIDSGALDALAHGIEGYFNVSSNVANQRLADCGFDLFANYKDRLLAQRLTGEDFDNMLLAASIQGMAVVRSSTTLPHCLGYPLTHDKGVCHGLASCVTLADYLRSFHTEENRKTVKDVLEKCGFSSIDALSNFIDAILERNVQLTVSEEEIDSWTKCVINNKPRLARHPEPVSYEDIHQMYVKSLVKIGAAQNK